MFTTTLKTDFSTFEKPRDYFKHLTGLISEFSLYLVIALAVIITAVSIILFLKKPSLLKSFKNHVIMLVTGFMLALVAIMTFLSIYLANLKGEVTTGNYYIVLAFLAYILLSVIAVIIVAHVKKGAAKITLTILAAIGIAFAIICAFALFKKDEYTTVLKGKEGLYYTLSLALILGLAIIGILFKRKGSYSDTKAITYAAVCIAVAYGLSYVKFVSAPYGGSVTLLSMLPLMLYSYMFGARKGIFAGIIYGILQIIQSPQIYEGMQVLLDYPIAFGFIGIAGMFRGFKPFKGNMYLEFSIGAVVAATMRYLSHVLSGIFVFYEWVGSDWSHGYVSWSFVYNNYVFIDLVLILLASTGMFASKSFRKEIERINPLIQVKN